MKEITPMKNIKANLDNFKFNVANFFSSASLEQREPRYEYSAESYVNKHGKLIKSIDADHTLIFSELSDKMSGDYKKDGISFSFVFDYLNKDIADHTIQIQVRDGNKTHSSKLFSLNEFKSVIKDLNKKLKSISTDYLTDDKSRLERAEKQGFDINTPYYHVTDSKIESFDINRTSDTRIWLTKDLSSAENGDLGQAATGVIMPLYIRSKKLGGWDEEDKYMDDQLIQDGFDGLLLDGDVALYHPEQIRSVDAAFLPHNRDSSVLKDTSQPLNSKLIHSILKDIVLSDKYDLTSEVAQATMRVKDFIKKRQDEIDIPSLEKKYKSAEKIFYSSKEKVDVILDSTDDSKELRELKAREKVLNQKIRSKQSELMDDFDINGLSDKRDSAKKNLIDARKKLDMDTKSIFDKETSIVKKRIKF